MNGNGEEGDFVGVVEENACVGVLNGERWGRGGVTMICSEVVPPLGEGGGVGAVIERYCFSATELRIPMRTERIVGTSCVISDTRVSLREVVRRSERGLPNSSEAVCSN